MKSFIAGHLSVGYVLDAAPRASEQLLEGRFPIRERQAPHVAAVQPQEVERAGNRLILEAATMQPIEIGFAVLIRANDFTIEDRIPFETGGLLHNARIALGPIGGVHGVEPHATGADMDLQPIAVVLHLVNPMLARGRCFGEARTEGWIKPGGAILIARCGLRVRHNIEAA